MGLGTKIKEVLHSDKDTKHTTADTSKTPGAFPADDVPRSQKNADTSVLESSGSPRSDKVPGKNSSEYTYGTHDSSMTGRDGLASGTHDTTGTHGTTGTTGSHVRTGSHDRISGHDTTGSHDHTGSHRHKLTKDSTTAPYWGDAERVGGLDKQPHGTAGGRYSPPTGSGNYNNTPQTHGLTGAGGSTTAHTNSRGPETGRSGMPHTSGGGAGLAHRPLDNDATRRDHKIDEYDAPTNSHGRGHGHGSLPGAAGAGLGAAALAEQHHRDDLRDYDTTQRYDGAAGHHGMGGGGVGPGMNAGRGYNDSYENTMSPGGNGYGNTMSHSGMGHNDMGHNTMGHNTMGGNTMGPNAGHGLGTTRSGVQPGMPGVGPSLLDPSSRNASPPQAGGATGFASGPGYGGSSHGSSEYGGAQLGGGSVMPRIQNSAGMGDGHFGPGHPGAKVMHRCDHCGNDNDISKYFSKEAVYRMS